VSLENETRENKRSFTLSQQIPIFDFNKDKKQKKQHVTI